MGRLNTKEFFRTSACRLGKGPAEHYSQFLNAFLIIEEAGRGDRAFADDGFFHAKVLGAVTGDLRKVGDAEHLVVSRKGP